MHRTFKQDCNATNKFKLSCDKQWLEVIEMNLTHNHETDQRTFHHLPQQRKHDESMNCSSCLGCMHFKYKGLKKFKKEVSVLSTLLQPCCIFIDLHISMLVEALVGHGYSVII